MSLLPRTAAALLAAFLLGSCTRDATTPWTPGVRIVSGANLTDTVQARPGRDLVVQVTGENGVPEGGVPVVFTSAATPCPGYLGTCAGIVFVSGTGYGVQAGDTTDAEGQARVRIGFGTRAGTARVAISAPQLGAVDTALFTVLPGHGYRIMLAPTDTVIEPGESFRLRGGVIDIFANIRSDPLAYSASASTVALGSNGEVTGTTLGGAWVRARTSAPSPWTDSVSVAVVPRVRLALSGWEGKIRLSTLTGSLERSVVAGIGQDWSPAGDQLVYVDDRGNGQSGLSVTDTLGHARQLPVPPNSTWPQYSADGQWIYFYTTSDYYIYRIHPDGTGLVRLMQGLRPAPAPDGVRIAAAAGIGLWVGDPVTQQGYFITTVIPPGAIRWSPDGQWIASKGDGVTEIDVVHPDGSGKLVFGGDPEGSLTWSPDGRWLLSGGLGGLQLIDMAARQEWALPVQGLYPAWRP